MKTKFLYRIVIDGYNFCGQKVKGWIFFGRFVKKVWEGLNYDANSRIDGTLLCIKFIESAENLAQKYSMSKKRKVVMKVA